MNTADGDRNWGTFLLPVQFDSQVRRISYGFEAEKSLMFGVLRDAIRVLLWSRGAKSIRRRHAFEETRKWFLQETDSHRVDVFGFEHVCDVLGINPNRLRERLGLGRSSREPPAEMRITKLPRKAERSARKITRNRGG